LLHAGPGAKCFLQCNHGTGTLAQKLMRNRNIVPDRQYTLLKFNGYGRALVPTVTGNIGLRFRPSSAFDVDPLLGSTATPGFAEWAAFYNNYRVTSSRIRISFSNTSSTQGVLVVVCPLNVDPGASPGVVVVNSWIDHPYQQHRIVGTAGSPPTTMHVEMSTEKIFGSKMIYMDDNFQALVTTNPVNNWYWALGFISSVIPGAPFGVDYLVDIEMGVEFFSRKTLQS